MAVQFLPWVAREKEKGSKAPLELHPLSLIRGLFKFEQKGIWIQMK
jgi:hypothetical protein